MSCSRRDFLEISLGATLAASNMIEARAADPTGQSESVKAGNPSEPTVKTRFFFTWDHSTEWLLNRPGAQTIGASNHYGRATPVFIEDYHQIFTWCGRHHIDAVVVWGLLRDMHGGIDSVHKLCDMAEKNGVRLLCGVGLNAYGGVYYEGDSPWSLENHLAAHPEMLGVLPNGDKMIYNFGVSGPKKTAHACPSRKENQDFAARSLEWLFKTFPTLGGVQMETGDTRVCQCKVCRERRPNPELYTSWHDMALMYPIAAEAIRSVSPDAWISCETYHNPTPYAGKDPDKEPSFGEGKPAWADECVAKFPENTFVQWVCDRYVKPKNEYEWTAAGTVKNGRHRHVQRSHFGTYWGGTRGEAAIDEIADMVRQSTAHGFEALYLFGEVSPFHTGAELNYLALEHFGSAANPKADPDIFVRDVAGPLLGGEDLARDFLKYGRLKGDPAGIAAALPAVYANCARLPPEPARRWAWLANFLGAFAYPNA
ncbi:MAG: hypothetical protein M1457_10515 [bacterium]|nr:hypothetical protein [bacterium]